MTLPKVDGYSYYINNDSDEEVVGVDSSDEEIFDEVDVFLYGTAKQKRKALKNLTGDEASSSDDDFESAMQTELDEKMKAMESSWKISVKPAEPTAASSSSQSSRTPASSEPKYYDDIYFDSDEEDKSKRQKLTDDELFYDPKADEEDQKWVDKQRKRLQKSKIKRKSKRDSQPTNASDATLTCPACMSTLCVDCQRHSLYQNQFRAMFVMNCEIKFDEVLHYKEKKKKEFKRHKKRGTPTSQDVISTLTNSGSGDTEGARYHPVKCTICGTEVAVYDSEEIYHFFNILSGPA